MQFAIIGAAGKMGSWFAGYFARKGFTVSAFDVKPFAIAGSNRAPSLRECVRDADFVLVCVPMQKTTELIRKCAKEMKKGSRLAEISSVKSATFPVLKKVRKDLQVLCVHPMFGPGADGTKNLKMLLVPVRDKADEQAAAEQAFSGMSISAIADARTHDKSIAVVLGLTYFVNIAFAGVISKEDLQALKQVGGTTFGFQSMLAESVMTDEPELAAALLRDNPYSPAYITRYLKGAQELARTKNLEPLLKKVKRNLQKQQDLQESYRRMYEMLRDGNIT
ncbi:prephenate dehydrogenase/arogenate dehydrogenase family protein [Nitrososphaera sp.]|uniref:prephenate dehydrogenase/arogenate dehydrogenase family protein n=1 Tax=Nitrososphaera sp. TaxID=1971748 RepID=UPI002EDAC347